MQLSVAVHQYIAHTLQNGITQNLPFFERSTTKYSPDRVLSDLLQYLNCFFLLNQNDGIFKFFIFYIFLQNLILSKSFYLKLRFLSCGTFEEGKRYVEYMGDCIVKHWRAREIWGSETFSGCQLNPVMVIWSRSPIQFKLNRLIMQADSLCV